MEVILTVSTREQVNQRVRGAFKGRNQGCWISFASVELMFKVMTTKRWKSSAR